ncbi:hypothetical protein FOZ63_016390, partial [Perkinsus olseni]
KQLGLFTTKCFPEGSLICEYSGRLLSLAQTLKARDRSYIMGGFGINCHIDAKYSFNVWGRYINDCKDTQRLNGKFVKDKKRRVARVVATRDIPAGSEVLASYGEVYWRSEERFSRFEYSSYFERVDMSRPVNGNPTIRGHADSATNGASKAKSDYYLEQYQSFNQDGQGCSPSDLGHLLRLCGFSPTNAMIRAFEAEVEAAKVEDPRVSPQQFLDFCGRCSEHLRQHTQLDLSAFFNPMDPGDTGLVSIKAFRAVMENAGEPFTREEVDIFIRDFSTDGLVLDYKAMIDTYARVLLRYEEDLYMRVCGPEQVYAAEVEACAECPPRCYHSRHLDPRAHELKCICDRNDPALWNFTMDDFAEKLTNAGSPHRLDTVFNDVREPTLHSIDPINATVVHYSRGIWNVVGLPIDLRCPNTTAKNVATAQALIRRFGLLAPPIPTDTLWWTLRPYTAFGVDGSVDSMLTQMAMVQHRGLLAMLIPT